MDEFSVQRLQVKWPNGLLPVSNKPISSYLCTRRRKGAWVQCKKENTLHYMKIILMEIPGSTSCAIQPSWMGEHGVNWEDMENMENMENTDSMEKNGKHQPDNLPLYLKFKILLCDSKR